MSVNAKEYKEKYLSKEDATKYCEGCINRNNTKCKLNKGTHFRPKEILRRTHDCEWKEVV